MNIPLNLGIDPDGCIHVGVHVSEDQIVAGGSILDMLAQAVVDSPRMGTGEKLKDALVKHAAAVMQLATELDRLTVEASHADDN